MKIEECKPGLAVNWPAVNNQHPGEILAVNTKTGVITVQFHRTIATVTPADLEPVAPAPAAKADKAAIRANS